MKITKETRKAFSNMGRRGGKACAERMTAKQRTARAKKAVAARWAKTKSAK